jgi:alkanesulfonate monooxygenase SsuD/methylene tetrahydromethanopterin reductase-like flavin-dependent oxidoreductase (luciferase family)
MTTGVVLFPNPRSSNLVDDVVAQASRAYDLGVRQVWLGQQHDHDAMALAALVGAAVPGLGVGTSVVPINPRHPLIVASLAQTDVRVSLARQTLPQWVQRNRSGGSFRAIWMRVRPMWY